MWNAFAQPADNVETGLFRSIIERHRNRCGCDLPRLQGGQIGRGPAGDDEKFVVPRVFKSLELERFFQRCDDPAAQGGCAKGRAAEIFVSFVISPGDEKLCHAVDDASGDDKVSPRSEASMYGSGPPEPKW